MKSVKLSLSMLKKNWDHNRNYALVILFLTTITFVVSNIVANPVLKEEMEVNAFGNYIPRYGAFVPVIIILFTMVLAVFAYMYLLTKKATELQIIKVSGGSLVKMTRHLFIQNIAMLLVYVPIGYVLGLLFTPLMNYIIYQYLYMNISIFHIFRIAFRETAMILCLVLIITTVLGMGYIYRNEIRNITENKSDYIVDKRSLKFPTIIHVGLYVLGIMMFFSSNNIPLSSFAFSVIGCSGAIGIIRNGMFKYLRNKNMKKDYKDKILNISNSNLAYAIKKSYVLIGILITTAVGMLAVCLELISSPKEYIIAVISYCIAMVMICVSIYFKYLNDLKNRNSEYLLLFKLGYSLTDIKKIVIDEIHKYYAIITVFPFVYILVILYRNYNSNTITLLTAIGFGAVFLVTIIFIMLLTKRTIVRNVKSEILGGMTNERIY